MDGIGSGLPNAKRMQLIQRHQIMHCFNVALQ